jgi:hypothetical protein
MTVILALVGLNAARPIRCQVGSMSFVHNYVTQRLMWCNSKLWVIFAFVSKPPDVLRFLIKQHFALFLYLCPGLWLPVVFLGFVINRSPQVRPNSPIPLCRAFGISEVDTH